MQFAPSYSQFLQLSWNNLPQHPVFENLQSAFVLRRKRLSFTPIEENRHIKLLCNLIFIFPGRMQEDKNNEMKGK